MSDPAPPGPFVGLPVTAIVFDDDPAPVYDRPDLACPLTWGTVRGLLTRARARPWTGNMNLSRAHTADTRAILTPDRPLRLAVTFDFVDAALHLSLSHPRIGPPPMVVDLPDSAELDAWARVFFADRHRLVQVEIGKVAHLRLFFDVDGKPYGPVPLASPPPGR